MNRQDDLFSNPAKIDIAGLTYVEEFISGSEEQSLVSHIEAGLWTHEFARRRQHYGMDYSRPDAREPAALPDWILEIGRRVVAAGLFNRMPKQALVNEYLPGQGIAPHKDYKPFEEVASLSLSSGCLMNFIQPETRHEESLWLARRSLVVLTGDARYKWMHGIRPRLKDIVHGAKYPRERRLSLTLRTL